LNDAPGWSSKLVDGYFLTSDLGEINDGKLTVTGRADDVIVTGGENISLTKVEEVIRNTFAGIECAAFAIADQQWGQALHLAIAGKVKPEISKINESLSSQISAAAKVKRVIYLDKLPRTSLDKVDRGELAKLAASGGE
jgi:O-succinylbenzoic acid--CoA ligase